MKKRQKTAFGDYLVEQIKIAAMSQEEFYNAVGIKKPYFYDLLTATPPPIELQDRMLAVLDGKTGADAGTAPDGFARADKIRHRKLVSETFCIAFTAEIINDQRIVPEFIGGFPESIVGIQTENF